MSQNLDLFHHQIATCTENVKFRAEKEVLLPGTVPGSKKIHLLPGTSNVHIPASFSSIFIMVFF